MAIEKDTPKEVDIEAEQEAVSVEEPQEPDIIETMEDGSVMVGPEPMPQDQFDSNLSEFMSDQDLELLASDIIEDFDNDKESRSDWEKTYTEGLDLLGIKNKTRTKPFEGASGVTHPLLFESVSQFQSQAYKEMLPPAGPVRTQIVGDTNDQKEEQAKRVEDFMNYQITQVMEEYDTELDQMLFYLPLAGSAFKKIYYDGVVGRAVSKFVQAEDLVIPYMATDLETAERITHIIRMSNNDIRKAQVTGFYSDIELTETEEPESDLKSKKDELIGVDRGDNYSHDMHTLLETHINLDLPGFEDLDAQDNPTGIKIPYIVTLDQDSKKILAIRRNYRPNDPDRKKVQYFVHFKFCPGLGFYGFGLIHMIGGLSKTATSVLRQLMDSGTLSNLPSGFKAKGIRIRDDDEPLQPGEFRDIDAPGGDLRAALVNLPFKEPSATLFQLLGFCVDAGRRFASMADQKIGEMTNQEQPVGTTMAILERGTKIMSAIHKRLHYAQKIEFKLLAKVFAESLPPEYPYEVVGGNRMAKAQDFDDKVDVLPVSDPNIFSMSQRITLAQTQFQLAQSKPDLHNIHEAYRRVYEALEVKNIESILPPPPKPAPMDPGLENSLSVQGKTLRAFPQQDHDSHIAAHLSFMKTPVVRANPPVLTGLQAHISEHIATKAREIVQQKFMQQTQQANMDQTQLQALQIQAESEIAKMIATLTIDIAEDEKRMMTGAGTEDPLVKLKEKDLDIKQSDVLRKSQVDKQKVNLEKQKISQKERLDDKKRELTGDIAQLRANVALEKVDTQKSQFSKKLVSDNVKFTQKIASDDKKNKNKKD
jgi:hypothetical protein